MRSQESKQPNPEHKALIRSPDSISVNKSMALHVKKKTQTEKEKKRYPILRQVHKNNIYSLKFKKKKERAVRTSWRQSQKYDCGLCTRF